MTESRQSPGIDIRRRRANAMQHNMISTPHGRCIPGDSGIVKLVSRPKVLVANTRHLCPGCAQILGVSRECYTPDSPVVRTRLLWTRVRRFILTFVKVLNGRFVAPPPY